MKGDTFVLGYTTHGSVMDGFMQSVIGLYMTDAYGERRIDHGRIFKVHGPYPSQNRSQLVQCFLNQTQADWLVMADADHFFEPQSIYNLVDSADKDEKPIVSAAYWGFLGEDPRLRLVWYRWNSNTGFQPVVELPKGIEEIDACGMGCCAIHRSVLEELRRIRPEDDEAWFSHDTFYDMQNKRLKYFGEDFTFCLRAKQAGFKIWGNPTVEVDHLKIGRQNRHTIDKRLEYDINGITKVVETDCPVQD